MKILIDTLILLPSTQNLSPNQSSPHLDNSPNLYKVRCLCLSSVRQKYHNSKISEQLVDILTKDWLPQTVKRNKPYIEKWLKFCYERNKDLVRPDLNDTIVFLTSVFHTGVGYSSINTARSALSLLIEPINVLH